MEVLVTGGAGYIGSHICVELLEAGYAVVVADNFSNSSPESMKRVTAITGKTCKLYPVDLMDRGGMERIFEENNIEAVIHCAGLKAVGESVEVPLHYYQNNIAGTLVLCEVMQKYGVRKLIFSSSATVYGLPEVMPVTETSALGAVNPYGRTKQMIEEILRDIQFSDPRWGIAILRYFNPIGAHPSGLIGEHPNGRPNNLLPYVSQVAAGRRSHLEVYGNDYETKDGTGVRDFIHVVDLASGHVKALEQVNIFSGIDAFNLGTGKGYSVLDMVGAFEKVSGRKVPFKVVARRPGDIAVCYADPSKAEARLGWRADKDIEQMCEDAWKWQMDNPYGYQTRQVEEQSKTKPLHYATVFLLPEKS